MSNPTKEYFAMPVVNGEIVNGWTALKWPGVVEGYQITADGQARSPEGRSLKPTLNGRFRYLTVRTVGGRSISVRMDRLMLNTFVGEPEDVRDVPIYADGDMDNLRLDNLRYGPAPKRVPHNKGKKMSKAPTPKRGAKPRSKADYDTIDVSRVYRHRGTGLTVAVDESGKAKMPKVNLTAAEMRAVALLSQRIAEMNQILGLDKQRKL